MYTCYKWEAEQILDYWHQNNKEELLVHWQGYESTDNSWDPIDKLNNALELLQEYWDKSHPNEPTQKITSHYIKTSWELMEVSPTPYTATTIPDDFWEPYDDEEYDSSSSEQDYIPTSDDELLLHRDIDKFDYQS